MKNTTNILRRTLLPAGLLGLSVNALAATATTCTAAGSCIVFGSSVSVTSTYDQTKYPVVLAHGMTGFSNIGPVDYWYGIPTNMMQNGANVYITSVSAFQSSEYRGEQLLNQVKTILAISGAKKVNLIGHSHGNQSIRYVAGVLPGGVASATSVSGPTKGSAVADLIKSASDLPVIGSPLTSALTSVVNGFGALVGLGQGQSLTQDSLAGLTSLTTAGAGAFNGKFPGGVPVTACGEGAYSANGVRFYSWGGTGLLTHPLDPIDYALTLTGLAFVGKADSQNDGLVSRCSNHFGQVIRDNYAMNHLDTVNQIFGLVNIFETNPVAVYRTHLNRLKLAGL